MQTNSLCRFEAGQVAKSACGPLHVVVVVVFFKVRSFVVVDRADLNVMVLLLVYGYR